MFSESDNLYSLRDRGSLLFLLGERREEPLLATARFPMVHAQTTSASVTRTAAAESGPGKRISRDLLVENNNLTAKGDTKTLGYPNIDNENIIKLTRSTGPLQKILKSNDDLGLSKRHTHHANKTRQDVFNLVLNQVDAYSPGRQYASFPGLKPILKSINCKQLHSWIKRHKTKCHRQNRNFHRK